MKNIELFDEYAAQILATLYQSFPVPAWLDAREISGAKECDEFGSPLDETGRRCKKFEIALETLNFLQAAGYISTKSKNQHGHSGVTLTAPGLQLLNATPTTLTAKEPLGERLVRLVREGSVSLVRETVKAIISAGVSAGLK